MGKVGRPLVARKGFSRRKFRSLRIRCGFSQGQLGAILGVSQTTISWWENGQSVPPIATRPLIWRVLAQQEPPQ